MRVHYMRWTLVVSFLAFWQWRGSASVKAKFFYSTPLEVVVRLTQELRSGTLLADTGVTCAEVVLGALAGFGSGLFLGLLFWWFQSFGRAVRPMFIGLATTPIFAVAPLLVFWFGVGFGGKIVVVALSVVFICLLATYQAACQIENDYADVAHAFHAPRSEVFQRIVFKGSVLLASSSYRLALLFGFVGAFIAEIISSSQGLGHFIQRSSGIFDVTGILAGLTVFIVCALSLNFLMEWVDEQLAKWR